MAYGPLAYARLAVDFRQCTYIVLWCSFCWKPHMHACRWDNRELSLVNTKLQMRFFSLTQILTLVYLCHSEDIWLQCCMSLFSVMHPLLFFSLYNPSRQQRMIALFYAYHIYITSLHIRGLKKVSLKKNSARCRVDILLYLYMYHHVYTHWFFWSFVKSDEI